MGILYLACDDKITFFTSDYQKRWKLWSCKKVCDASICVLDNSFIRCGTTLHKHIVEIPMQRLDSTSSYLGDLLNIDNPYFEGMVSQIYPAELQLNKANTSNTEASFLDLHLSILDGFVSSKLYDKRDVFISTLLIYHF